MTSIQVHNMKRSVATPFTNFTHALVSTYPFYIGLLHAFSSYTYTVAHTHTCSFSSKVYLGALFETYVLKSISIRCVHHRYLTWIAWITKSCMKWGAISWTFMKWRWFAYLTLGSLTWHDQRNVIALKPSWMSLNTLFRTYKTDVCKRGHT